MAATRFPAICLRYCEIKRPLPQVRLSVHDTGNPDKSAITTVRIPVTRNVNTPRFDKQSYEATINENAPVGISILSMKATDQDQVNLSCVSGQHGPANCLGEGGRLLGGGQWRSLFGPQYQAPSKFPSQWDQTEEALRTWISVTCASQL